MSVITPTELLQYDLGLEITVDTETSGKYPDDGCATSVVSIAWVADEPVWEELAAQGKITLEWERITDASHPAGEVNIRIASVAWPFDQGLLPGKPEYTGQEMLWVDVKNLPRAEWDVLLNDLLPSYKLIMHNGVFDVPMLRKGTRLWPGRELVDQLIRDTSAEADFAWRFTGTVRLKDTCERVFPWRPIKDEQEKVKSYLKKNKLPAGRYDLVAWDVLGPYADLDARLTMMLAWRVKLDLMHGILVDWVDAEEAANLLRRRMQVIKTCIRMEAKGLPYDELKSRETGQDLIRRAGEVAKLLPFKPPTDAAAKKYFFTADGLDLIPYSITEKGSPSLTEEIVQRMVTDQVEHADTWSAYNKLTNAASMWYIGYADKVGPDSRLRTRFRVFGTRSGRFSVERVNLQAIPQDYRLRGHAAMTGVPTPRDFIKSATPPGWRIWELDLAQAELRYGAYLAKCKRMLDMIVSGEDLHGYTTQELFNVGPDSSEWGQYRQVGKRANFSLLFGSGARTFQSMISKETGIILPDNEAARIVRDWNALYPEFKHAIQIHMERVISRQNRYRKGWVTLANGERRWFQRYEDPHKAFNQRVQGDLAQFASDWMVASDEYLAECGYDEHQAGLLLTIHDSQMLLLPDNSEGEAAAAYCATLGRSLWAATFPGVPGDVDYKGK